jgi:hypothetical protein
MGRLPRPLGALTAAVLTIGALAVTQPFEAAAVSSTPFAVRLGQSSVTVERGSSASVAVSITRTTADRSSVFLGARNVPTGLSLRFNDNPIVRNTNITLRPATSLRNGSYRVSISGSSKGRTSTQTLTVKVVDPGAGDTEDTLPPIGGAPVTTAPAATTAPATTVPAAPEFTIVPASPVLSAAPGAQATTALNIQRAANFVGPVSVAVEGMPQGGFANISPNPITGAQGTLTLLAPPANGNVTLTLRSGTRSATVTLQVGTNPGTGTPTATTTPSSAVVDYDVRLVATAGSVPQGAAGELGMTIVRAAGFTTPVTFAATGQPTGVTVTFSPNPATGTDAKATISVAAGTPVGSYPLTITAIAGSSVRTVPFTLAVVAGQATPNPPGVPTMQVSPTSVSVGQTGTATVAITVTNATVPLTLQVSGSTPLPAGTTASFAAPSTQTGTVLTITTANAPAGTYTLTVIGQGGATVLSGNFTLVVGTTPGSDFAFGTVQALTISRGNSGLTAVPVAWTGTPAPITFATGTPPAGITTSFPTQNPSATGTTLQVNVSTAVAPGTYSIPITGTAGSLIKTTLVSITVT